ncbi:MAG: hypothetical protein QOE37_1531 [Microbacteriaceae bacterium]|jgi:quinol monooxygenase YgiN|nr:hypothetical protein [Microbacteriaceae bacterium]
MIDHTVCFTLVHPADSDAERAFLESATATLAAIPGVTDFDVARQVSPMSDYRFRFAMRFADAEAYRAYNEHPDHVAFVRDAWNSEVASFQELDFVPWP